MRLKAVSAVLMLLASTGMARAEQVLHRISEA